MGDCPTCTRKFKKVEDFPSVRVTSVSKIEQPEFYTATYRDDEQFVDSIVEQRKRGRKDGSNVRNKLLGSSNRLEKFLYSFVNWLNEPERDDPEDYEYQVLPLHILQEFQSTKQKQVRDDDWVYTRYHTKTVYINRDKGTKKTTPHIEYRKERDITEEVKGIIQSPEVQQYLDSLKNLVGKEVKPSKLFPNNVTRLPDKYFTKLDSGSDAAVVQIRRPGEGARSVAVIVASLLKIEYEGCLRQ